MPKVAGGRNVAARPTVMTNVILRTRIHPLLSIPVLKSGRGRRWAPSCGKLDVNDEFDIKALRNQYRSAVFVDRRQVNRAPEPRQAGPDLFEWAGLADTPVEEPEVAPDWPPVVVPIGSMNRARPFGRRAELVAAAEAPAQATQRQAAAGALAQIHDFPVQVEAYDETAIVRRYLIETPEVPLDPREDEFEETYGLEDEVSPDELAAAARAVAELQQTIDRLHPAAKLRARPAEATLRGLLNTLLLEQDRIEARLAEQQPPLLLASLKRHQGERETVDVVTANDRA